MSDSTIRVGDAGHNHVFLGAGHEKNERKTWAVIALCSAMMLVEIVGGSLFGSLAVVADGLHMSTHAAAMLIAALAYTYARRHASDPSFAFGTGKLGDLAGFSSAIILAMIALLIGYEAVSRLIHPIAIDVNQAIAIAAVGLLVNIASAWLLSGGDHGHSHGHSHGHAHGQHGDHEDEIRRIDTGHGFLLLEVFEDGVPPRFRARFEGSQGPMPVPGGQSLAIETVRPGGARQTFTFANRGAYLESVEEIPEPHEFTAQIRLAHSGHAHTHEVAFEEHGHEADGGAHRDNNMRAAFVHVVADAAVSVLAILGLLLAKFFGWTFMDPVMGIVGMLVIANWSFGLVRDTGGVLLDKTADRQMADRIRREIETDGDRVTDLHLWRLGPGHLGAIVSVTTSRLRAADFYRARLARFGALSHLTVEVHGRAGG
ncbi:cation transporter [Aliidongia dinghuensis]|uniref:Cation transporter n=1 Tax=Aliidongia dinghuensis TaxID=1867774 RepID=A0A8J3E1A7_9PROT|nr:CDF family Co(II)/Ni(II) efflux transporter DmeF [Aliidongia dinghuensis]GGF10213.1 cation transporter [Aliidongia dinghuensis]